MSTKCLWPECQDYTLILAKYNKENLIFVLAIAKAI